MAKSLGVTWPRMPATNRGQSNCSKRFAGRDYSGVPSTPELEVTAPFSGTVIAVARAPGEQVPPGAAVIVLEAMKMEHEVVADLGGVVRAIEVAVGDTVQEGQRLAILTADGSSTQLGDAET